MMPDYAAPLHVADDIRRVGHAVVPAFVDAATVGRLAGECRALHASAQLRPAAIGRKDLRHVDRELRGDVTRWFDAAALTAAQRPFWSRLDALREQLDRELFLGLRELEAHYALYPPGARYARHRDRFRDDDARVLSAVLYLNDDWNEADGGALRLYFDTGASTPYRDIAPHAGTLVLFLSAEFDHEVLPATRERLSVAAWFRRAAS